VERPPREACLQSTVVAIRFHPNASHMPALLSIPLVLLAAALSASACGDDPAGPGSQAVQWEQVQWSGGTTNVAILRPTGGSPGPHPVIFALPWGEGTGDLVLSFIQRYWKLSRT